MQNFSFLNSKILLLPQRHDKLNDVTNGRKNLFLNTAKFLTLLLT